MTVGVQLDWELDWESKVSTLHLTDVAKFEWDGKGEWRAEPRHQVERNVQINEYKSTAKIQRTYLCLDQPSAQVLSKVAVRVRLFPEGQLAP
jgi:hypothetical protein